jgi:predicted NBD/HSP70 family sugar kinase
MTRNLTRRFNAQAVIEAAYANGPVTRAQLATLTGLSKPTVSSIVTDLLQADLLRSTGRTAGKIGRTAELYEVNSAVGYVVGVDLGGTKVRAAICDLFGRLLDERVVSTAATSPDDMIEQIRTLVRELSHTAGVDTSSVRVVAVGTPGTIDPFTGRIGLAFNVPSFADVDLAERLAAGTEAAVVLDNDVNVAAVGERWQGLARNCDNFVFLAIGTGIGAGLMLNGEIWQGQSGAAGEVGYLPVGGDAFDPANRKRGAFEEAAAGAGLVRRFRDAGSKTRRLTAADIFDAAAAGDEAALAAVDEEARTVAVGIAAIAAVVAPEMVVLGGGIGSNELLLEPVRRYVADLVPFELPVLTSDLGHRATLVGALALGLQEAHAILFPRQTRRTGGARVP